MRPSRRSFSFGLAGASLLPFVGPAWSVSEFAVGEARVDVVSDGKLILPGDFLFAGMPEPELREILSRFQVDFDNPEPDCNLTVYRDGERTIVFDVGAGPNFMPSAGKVGEALDVLGLDPSQVTHVVFTHAHPDHLWGLLDDFDEPVFPEAEYKIAASEWDYWTDPKTVETIGDARQSFAAGAARLLGAIEDNISFFKPDDEVLPGVLARATHGHTPGHTSF
ncbi:MAG: MBL fold metallo-hydrolase, partial [Pseudomonadota bacterium]